MLVLSRKVGEKLMIGDNITVVISRVAGNRVTIGIEAPPDVRIMRGELDQAREEAVQNGAALPASSHQKVVDTANASVFRLAK
jgi:carbon storage regulator